MSAINIFTLKDDVIAAMADVKLRINRVLKIAEVADSAALSAIMNYQTTGNAAYLACIAAERAWNGFIDEYDGIANALSVLNGGTLGDFDPDLLESYTDAISGGGSNTGADHWLNTPADLGIYLGQILAICDSILGITKQATAETGPEEGLAALELASYAHQILIWKCGIHWPEIYGNKWPRSTMRVMRIERLDYDAGAGEDWRIVVASLTKDTSLSGTGIDLWFSYLWACATTVSGEVHTANPGGIRDASWDYPPDIANGDILRIEIASPDESDEVNAEITALVGRELTVADVDTDGLAYNVIMDGHYNCDTANAGADMPDDDDGNDWPIDKNIDPISSFYLRKIYSYGAPSWPTSGEPPTP